MARCSEYFMRLSSGYLFPEVARRTRVWQEKHPGRSVLRLGIGNTTEALPPVIVEAMKNKLDLLSDRATYTGYGDEQGDAPLREAICRRYSAFGVDIRMSEVFVSDGAKSDAANIQSIFSTDSVIAVQDPSYPVYVDSNVASGHTSCYNEAKSGYDGIVYMPAYADTGFVASPPSVHADLIYLCFPNNPTGATATKDELKLFVDYALEHRSVIIFDAAYSDYIRTPDIPHSIYEIEGAERCAIELNSFSKYAGFTGVRLGWSIVPEALEAENAPAGTLNRLWNRRQCTFFNGASCISQAGGIAALSPEGQAECNELVEYYLGNARIIRSGLEGIGLRCFGGIDSPYVWAACPDNLTSWEFFDLLLDKASVVVSPGSGFGPAGEGYVRVSAYGHREDVEKAVRSIEDNI